MTCSAICAATKPSDACTTIRAFSPSEVFTVTMYSLYSIPVHLLCVC